MVAGTAGVNPLRQVYDLRHTFATFAFPCRHLNLRALPLYGRQPDDDRPPLRPPRRHGREHAIKLLDALNAPEFDPWTLVDARWTPKQPTGVNPENQSVTKQGEKLKPSDGLEPSTPSLPSQTVAACVCEPRIPVKCSRYPARRLRLVAGAG
jgi:hypothetical protein